MRTREQILQSKRDYYQRNKAKHIADCVARRRAKGPGSRSAEGKKYYASHKKQILKTNDLWKKAHPEKAKIYDARSKAKRIKRNRELAAIYRANNREQMRAYRAGKHDRKLSELRVKKWKRLNPEGAKAVKRRRVQSGKVAEEQNRRRARVLQNGSKDCSKAFALLRHMPLCQYCFTLIDGTPTVDHVIPIARGGAHVPTNLAAACGFCNSSKGHKLVSEWNNPRLLKEAA